MHAQAIQAKNFEDADEAFTELTVAYLDFLNNDLNTMSVADLNEYLGTNVANFDCYTTLAKAVDDVNADTTENADTDLSHGTAAIFEKDGQKNIVMLRNSASKDSYIVSVDSSLYLNGKTITAISPSTVFRFNKSFTVDGTKEGSSIVTVGESSSESAILFGTAGDDLTITGGNYTIDSKSSRGNIAVYVGANDTVGNLINQNVTIDGATINVSNTKGDTIGVRMRSWYADDTVTVTNSVLKMTGTNSYSYGVYGNGDLTMSNCDISVFSDNTPTAEALFWSAGDAALTDCDIRTDFNVPIGYKASISSAIHVSSNAEFNNCNVYADAPGNDVGSVGSWALSTSPHPSKTNGYSGTNLSVNSLVKINGGSYYGTHAGVDLNGTTEIDGGTFTSSHHGGIYFAAHTHDSSFNPVTYIKNATLGSVAYSGNHMDAYNVSKDNGFANGQPFADGLLSDFYIGGGSGYDNISVYMDSCTLTGKGSWSSVLRGTAGEKNNHLYISNTLIPTGKKARVDANNYLHVGVGTNITDSNLAYITSSMGTVEYTNETYIK